MICALPESISSRSASAYPSQLTCAECRRARPSPADDHSEGAIDLNERLIRNKVATFIVCVEGESMIGAGISSGDHLIVDRSIEARHNDIVIACINGEMTVKRLVLQDAQLLLVSENLDYSPIPVNGDAELIIWGVVTYTIHKAR